jgi:hypothetical protein
MSLIEIKWHPTKKELRDFGIIALGAAFVISIFLFAAKSISIRVTSIILAIGLFIFLCSLVSLKLTRFIYLGLTLSTLPIGWCFSFIILAIFYFLILTPIGLLFRIFGRDPLCRKFDKEAESYWINRRSDDNPDRYFRQF